MKRERVYGIEVIVLRRRNWGEADRILTLFSPERGKFRARAVGVRRPQSRKAGHLELFTRANLLLARGRDMDVITQAETLEAYRPLRDDLVRSAAAHYAVEMLDRFSPDEEESRPAFQLLSQTLEALCTDEMPGLALRFYELHLLEIMGYRPQLQTCVMRRETIKPRDQSFSFALGGVVCPRCAPGANDAVPLSLAALRVMRHLQRETYAAVRGLKVRPAVLAEAEQILRRYAVYLLERPLRSADFLSEVSEPQP